MEAWGGVRDVIVLLTAAMVLGVLFERVRQSALVGYLLAGAVLGPGVLNVVRNTESVRLMAELGVALLLFTIGLEFSVRRLRNLGRVALLAGSLQIVLTLAAAAVVSLLFGLSMSTAVAIGIIVAQSSTACVLRVLSDRAETDSPHGRLAIGVLLLQDVALIPLMLLMTTLGATGTLGDVLSSILVQLGFAVLLIAALYVLTSLLLPRVFDAAAVARNREWPILLAILTCLGATYAAHAAGLSHLMGSFVAGVMLAESPYATGIRADVSVLRTVFVTLFFTSIGMLADVPWLLEHWHWVLGLVAALVAGKAAIVWLIGWMCRIPPRVAIAAGLCLAHTGEFSFVLAGVAQEEQLIDDHLFRLIVASTLVTLLLMPYLSRVAPPVGRWLADRLAGRPARRLVPAPTEETRRPLSEHVILIGFGPAGQGVLRALRSANVGAAVVDLNHRAIMQARADGLVAFVGDATHELVLNQLHLRSARAVVITVPDHLTTLQIVKMVRDLAPDMRVFARSRYHLHARELQQVCGVRIVDEELETGEQLGEELLEELGLSRRDDRPNPEGLES